MSLHAFLELTNLLQTITLAVSIFNLASFLWLALTVWLNGNRSAGIARLGVVGLGFSALFFFVHALLITTPLTQPGDLPLLNALWHLIWIPAISVPYIWFAIGLHYAALINDVWRRRRPLLLLCSGVLGAGILLLLLFNQSTFTLIGTLRLLAYGQLFDDNKATLISLPVLLPVIFLIYVTFCAIGPWFTLGRISRVLRALWKAIFRGHGASPLIEPSLRRALSRAFWDNPPEVELLEEPLLSWHLARPGLFFAAIIMVILTTVLGALGVWSLTDWFVGHHETTALNIIPFQLLALDLFATTSVAIVILLIGYSIVRHGILIERPLSRRGFFKQWRGIVIVATAVSIFIALLVTLTGSDLFGLLLISTLATVAYALFTWSSYTAHDRYIALLGPFLRSTNVRHWLNTDLQKTEQGLEDLFFLLCHDVLAVQCARLTVMAGSLRRNFDYRWPDTGSLPQRFLARNAHKHPAARSLDNPQLAATHPKNENAQALGVANRAPKRVQITIHDQPMICWVLPIYDELGPVATLYLGPREDGGSFTDEDMDLALACSERILDTLGDHEAMQAVAALLRRRVIDVKLLGAQHRRVLHDDILPQMHLALLRLETLRSHIHDSSDASVSASKRPVALRGGEPEQLLDEAVERISDAHRRLAAMMRATSPGSPHRLESEGTIQAIHTMLEQDFQSAFDEIEWSVSEETAQCIDEITPPAIAELIFAAVQEAFRNAARHARGSDIHRRLRLTFKATCHRSDPCLEIVVADDGVGIISTGSATTGTGGGLLTHGALLAIAGGNLTVKSAPGEGVMVRITLPPESLL